MSCVCVCVLACRVRGSRRLGGARAAYFCMVVLAFGVWLVARVAGGVGPVVSIARAAAISVSNGRGVCSPARTPQGLSR